MGRIAFQARGRRSAHAGPQGFRAIPNPAGIREIVGHSEWQTYGLASKQIIFEKLPRFSGTKRTLATTC